MSAFDVLMESVDRAAESLDDLERTGSVSAADMAELKAAVSEMRSASDGGRWLDAVAASRRARARCDVLLGAIFGAMPPIGRA